jgi:hypothetical protein
MVGDAPRLDEKRWNVAGILGWFKENNPETAVINVSPRAIG